LSTDQFYKYEDTCIDCRDYRGTNDVEYIVLG